MRVYCPYCKKEVKYKIEKKEVNSFKGIEIDTFENVGICEECQRELYIPNIEDENLKRINDKYREKVDIIKPIDIIKFREKYNISQRELTVILDFGKMTINRYENGSLPTKSQSDYLKLLFDNDDEFLRKVEKAYNSSMISSRTYNKIKNLNAKNNTFERDIQDLYRKSINEKLKDEPSIYNGYKKFDLNKVENIISYIASKVSNLSITSLNKYLWFIDSISVNKRGISITGLKYEHQQFGPTVIDKKYNEISLLDDKYVREDYEDDNGTKTVINSKENYNLKELKENEIKIIDEVIELLKNKKVTQISELSHKEDGWKKTNNKEQISFEYAMNLKILGDK